MVGVRSPGLVGRELELERMVALLDPEGSGGTKLLLEGEAGIGKTTLWSAGIAQARELGYRVLESQPAAAERELSFAGLGDLFDGVHDEIGRLPAPQRRALRIALVLEEAEGAAPEQRAIAVAATELLRRLAKEQPVLVALDDAQWLDAPSASALEFAVRRLDRALVRVLATARLNGQSPIPLDTGERMTIGPLSLEALDELVRERYDARLLRPTLRQLRDGSGGNPFFALELVAELMRSGRRLEPGEQLPIPARLRELVAARLDALTPPAREATLAASALAQPTVATLAAAIGESASAVAEAVDAGVLERDGETVRFSHPLFAATVYEQAAPVERKAMHKRLARIVTDPEERARQLAVAADGPDANVAAFVEAAAASVAARGAPDAAVRLAKLAVELTPTERRNVLHKRRLDCARYAFAAGDPAHAQTLLDEHLELANSGRERAEVRLELGRTALATRGVSAAISQYERALQEVDGGDELELQATILTELADMHLAELRQDSDVSERAVALAEQVWNPRLLARALALHGLTLHDRRESPPEEYWRRALEIERGSGELADGGPAHIYGVVLFTRGEFERARTCLREVSDSMRRRGNPLLPNVLLQLSDVTRALGRWDEAIACAKEAGDVARQTGRDSLEPLCLLYEARLAMLRGELAQARTGVRSGLAALERLGRAAERDGADDRAVPEGLANSLLGRIALTVGSYDEAHQRFLSDIEALRRIEFRALRVEALADDVTALIALGLPDQATREVDEMEQVAAELGDQFMEALAARSRGLVAAAAGDAALALESLERSRNLLQRAPSPWPFEAARTLLALGSVQRRARRNQAARASLDEALQIFERLGARLWAERTRSELGQISGRPLRDNALTETERRVAELVATGRSNAEAAHELVMSPKTVEWNLSKIYKKLHVRSRTELAAKLAQAPAARQS